MPSFSFAPTPCITITGGMKIIPRGVLAALSRTLKGETESRQCMRVSLVCNHTEVR